MAVFTPVTPALLSPWLERLAVGPVRSLQPIAAGIENTNYFVSTEQGEFVLTLFEKLQMEELTYYLDLMQHLSHHGIPCPRPLPDRAGRLVGTLCAKPAALVTRLPGSSPLEPGLCECRAMGAMVARLHLAGADFPKEQHPNPRGEQWRNTTARTVLPFLEPTQQRRLEQELEFLNQSHPEVLPGGPIHADLFRDNVLFTAPDTIGGVFDFYFAGTDFWLYDLAIVVNDWCTDAAGVLDQARSAALVRAYEQVRPVSAVERESWPRLLRAAALRFWLSRSFDKHLPRSSALLTPHDPARFERILAAHATRSSGWPGVWP